MESGVSPNRLLSLERTNQDLKRATLILANINARFMTLDIQEVSSFLGCQKHSKDL
jgi:hypothetical protein